MKVYGFKKTWNPLLSLPNDFFFWNNYFKLLWLNLFLNSNELMSQVHFFLSKTIYDLVDLKLNSSVTLNLWNYTGNHPQIEQETIRGWFPSRKVILGYVKSQPSNMGICNAKDVKGRPPLSSAGEEDWLIIEKLELWHYHQAYKSNSIH